MRCLAVGQNQDGRLELFGVGLDMLVYHKWEMSPNGQWSDWKRLGDNSNQVTEIAVGKNQDGRLEVFTVTTDRRILHAYQGGAYDGWSAFLQLGTDDDHGHGIVVGSNQDGRLEVFAIGQRDDGIYHIWQMSPNSGWSSWLRLGLTTHKAKQIAVEKFSSGRLGLFAIGLDDFVYHWVQDPSGTNGWSSRYNTGTPPELAEQVLAITDASGLLELFVLGLGGAIYHRRETSGATFSPWNGFGANTAKYLAAGRNLDGRIELITVGLDDTVRHFWQDYPSSPAWYGGDYLGTATNMAKQIAVGRHADGRLKVCTIGTNNRLYHFTQTQANNGWAPEGKIRAAYLNLSIIKVGSDLLSADDLALIEESVWWTREIFGRVGLFVDNVGWYSLTSAEAGGYVDIDNNEEAKSLTEDYSTAAHAVDVFVVRTFVGAGGVTQQGGGPCDKNAMGYSGCVVSRSLGHITTGYAMAHEVCHYLGPGHLNDIDNLMNPQVPNGGNLTAGQVSDMMDHCFIEHHS